MCLRFCISCLTSCGSPKLAFQVCFFRFLIALCVFLLIHFALQPLILALHADVFSSCVYYHFISFNASVNLTYSSVAVQLPSVLIFLRIMDLSLMISFKTPSDIDILARVISHVQNNCLFQLFFLSPETKLFLSAFHACFAQPVSRYAFEDAGTHHQQ